jgi:hypothetical protein
VLTGWFLGACELAALMVLPADPFHTSSSAKAMICTVTEVPSKRRILLARLAAVLMAAFVVIGVTRHGVSAAVWQRIWENLLDRPSGPMPFRFILQPIMAAIAAFYDGIKDAKAGRSPYLWAMLIDSAARSGRLHEGLISTARIILLGLCIDVIYQFIELKAFHPGEAVIIALLLAFVPYLLLRGMITRIVYLWRGDGISRKIY